MAKYPEKAQPYLNAIADGVFGDVNISCDRCHGPRHSYRHPPRRHVHDSEPARSSAQKRLNKTDHHAGKTWSSDQDTAICGPISPRPKAQETVTYRQTTPKI